MSALLSTQSPFIADVLVLLNSPKYQRTSSLNLSWKPWISWRKLISVLLKKKIKFYLLHCMDGVSLKVRAYSSLSHQMHWFYVWHHKVFTMTGIYFMQTLYISISVGIINTEHDWVLQLSLNKNYACLFQIISVSLWHMYEISYCIVIHWV